jgi:hypothetical protein
MCENVTTEHLFDAEAAKSQADSAELMEKFLLKK